MKMLDMSIHGNGINLGQDIIMEITLWDSSRALDRGRIGVFYAFKMPKTHWRSAQFWMTVPAELKGLVRAGGDQGGRGWLDLDVWSITLAYVTMYMISCQS
jgi:hypothetical protein